jgi:aryl-alcohol dehydrogenase-like predicted oxidoreductase
MDHRHVAGIGLPLPRLILGTLSVGLGTEDQAFALFDAAMEVGCNAFDSAAVYARGEAEQLLGRWIERRGVRGSVVIIDKGCHPAGPVARVNPVDLDHDLRRSLERLRADHIDLYLLHRDNPEVPVGEIVEALNEHLQAGRIHAFGASNWTHARIDEANQYAARRGLVPFAASSPAFSLARSVKSWPGCISIHPDESDSWDWYRRTRFPVLGWSPLAFGFLTGRFSRENADVHTDRRDRQVLEFYASEENYQRLERLAELARQKDISVARAALAYVLKVPLGIHAIIGSRDPAELRDCAAVFDVRLTGEDVAWLEGRSYPPSVARSPQG